jgi:hypothetical protein
MSGSISLNSGKYIYTITYKKKPGNVTFERPVKNFSMAKIRTTHRIYFDHRDKVVKEIIYPKDLWFTEVLEDDPVERYLSDCIDFIPDWEKIEIKNNETE